MMLAGKTFRAIANSSNDTLDTDTFMTFVSETESGILGVYSGGTIRTGNVVARRKSDATVHLARCSSEAKVWPLTVPQQQTDRRGYETKEP